MTLIVYVLAKHTTSGTGASAKKTGRQSFRYYNKYCDKTYISYTPADGSHLIALADKPTVAGLVDHDVHMFHAVEVQTFSSLMEISLSKFAVSPAHAISVGISCWHTQKISARFYPGWPANLLLSPARFVRRITECSQLTAARTKFYTCSH